MTEYKKLQKNTNWPYLERPLNCYGFLILPISSEFFPGIGIDSFELMKVMEHEVFDANEKFETHTANGGIPQSNVNINKIVIIICQEIYKTI